MSDEPKEVVHWYCHSCGETGFVQCAGETPFRRVVLDVENMHAAKDAGCPWDRDRITLSVIV